MKSFTGMNLSCLALSERGQEGGREGLLEDAVEGTAGLWKVPGIILETSLWYNVESREIGRKGKKVQSV
jgi:hypothetical protein